MNVERLGSARYRDARSDNRSNSAFLPTRPAKASAVGPARSKLPRQSREGAAAGVGGGSEMSARLSSVTPTRPALPLTATKRSAEIRMAPSGDGLDTSAVNNDSRVARSHKTTPPPCLAARPISRAEVFTTSPMTVNSARLALPMLPAKARPVVTPAATMQRDADSYAELPHWAATCSAMERTLRSAAHSSRAARAARDESSRWACGGQPHTRMATVPLSSVSSWRSRPPCLSSTSCTCEEA